MLLISILPVHQPDLNYEVTSINPVKIDTTRLSIQMRIALTISVGMLQCKVCTLTIRRANKKSYAAIDRDSADSDTVERARKMIVKRNLLYFNFSSASFSGADDKLKSMFHFGPPFYHQQDFVEISVYRLTGQPEDGQKFACDGAIIYKWNLGEIRVMLIPSILWRALRFQRVFIFQELVSTNRLRF